MPITKAAARQRNEAIRKMLAQRNEHAAYVYTYQEIGDIYSITRERVRQIGKQVGLSGRWAVRAEMVQRMWDDAPVCAVEHCENTLEVLMQPKPHYSSTKRCAIHGRDMVLITCSWCGKESERERYQAYSDHRSNAVRRGKKQKNWFCDKTCQGKYIGENFGFVAHPENMRNLKGEGVSSLSLEDLKKIAES